jgi:predicted type IV restriction endonuclease
MLLDDLVRVIETLKERIAAHGTALRENETRTRMALVDPMLAALGWDTSDPALVLPEYAAAHGRADYALVAPDGKPAALIEAKKLGEALAPHRLQMLNYSNAVGVAFAGLTNGDHWELYEVFQQKPLDERRILQLSIVEATSHHCTLELLLLWRPNLATGQPTRANEPISVPPPVDSPPSHPPGRGGIRERNEGRSKHK